jgi:PAS domain S-box-containing protein
VGRPLRGVKHNLDFDDLERWLAEVIESGSVREQEVQDNDGYWYCLRARPYVTLENKIDGAVLVVVDIDLLKRTEQEMMEARNFAQSAVESGPALLILDKEFRVQAANESFCQAFRVSRARTENFSLFELAGGQWNIPALRSLLEGILSGNNFFKDFEVTQEFEELGRRSLLLAGRRVGDLQRILLTFEDITERLNSQAAVRISELRYRRLFEAAKDGILILDPDTRKITEVNPFMGELLSYSRAELLGKELWEIGLWKDQDASQAAFRELQDKGFIRYEDLPLQTKAGERRDVEFVSNLYQEGDRKVIQCNIRDITARNEAKAALRQSKERFQFMAESLSQKIFTAKPNGDVGYFNQQWVDFTGLPFEQIKVSGWTQFIHPDDLEENVRQWKHSIQTGEPFQSEPRLRRKDGVYRWHLTQAHAMHDPEGKVLMWIGSNTDIDDQKRAMEELREAKEKLSHQAAELERQVEERTASLLGAVGELQAFSYTMAHDMRAPLRAMQGFAQTILESHADKLDATGINYLGRITRSAIRLDRLVQDVLSYTKILETEAPNEPINVDQLVRDIIETYPDWQPPKAEIEIQGELPKVLGNEAFLTQCISNLLGNAVKFVAPGTRPRVRIYPESLNSQVRIWFADNGIGVAPANHARLFRMFERIHAAHEFEGTGIGLAIVRKAVERMGGRAGLESVLGQGSKFWIQLEKG